MLVSVFSFSRHFLRPFRRLIHTMDSKAIVRRVEGESSLSLTFKYSTPHFAERTFTFNRKPDEELKIALARIGVKISELTNKKLFRKQKKKKPDDASESQTEVETVKVAPNITLLIDGKIVNETETIVSEAFKQGAILKIDDVELEIEVNPPLIASISLPKHIMIGFNVCPKIDVEFSVKSECRYVWYRSTKRFTSENDEGENSQKEKSKSKINLEKIEWEQVGESFFYVPSNDDIGRYLKIVCVPIRGSIHGPQMEAVSPVEVSAGPGPCPFEKRHLFTTQKATGSSFRVVTYNLLADLYADSDFSRDSLFPTCPPYALSIDYRKQLLVKELMGYNADVICLQEVDFKIFENDLTDALTTLNMEGHLASKGGKVAEGLACFYNKEKFQLVRHQNVELSQVVAKEGMFSDFLAVIDGNDNLKSRFMDRTTVLQIVVLDSLNRPGTRVCVANTHLYFHPNADHIRLLQAGVCLRYIEQVVAQEISEGFNTGLVFCGDFNSTPESGVYQLLTTQFIPSDYERWNTTPEEEVKGLSLSHSFEMISACGTPEYTNYTVGFNGCLDYIYSDSRQFVVKEVVPLPSHEEVVQFEALPSITIPSDHIALICTLDWKNK